jgi:hypothetical protein
MGSAPVSAQEMDVKEERLEGDKMWKDQISIGTALKI